MTKRRNRKLHDLETFGFEPGRRLGGKYVVNGLLGAGWEGEVYHVTEIATKVERAAKFFFPKRNPGDRTVTRYARKLHKLRECPIVIQYHTQETLRYRGERIAFLVSELVHGELLPKFLARQPGHRLHPFEAMHLLYTLAAGVEQIHRHGEYHGDLHSENIIVERRGIGFKARLVDLYYWGRPNTANLRDDLFGLIRVFYESIGGAKAYAKAPPEVKAICCGLKRSLILKRFRTVRKLREHLEAQTWT